MKESALNRGLAVACIALAASVLLLASGTPHGSVSARATRSHTHSIGLDDERRLRHAELKIHLASTHSAEFQDSLTALAHLDEQGALDVWRIALSNADPRLRRQAWSRYREVQSELTRKEFVPQIARINAPAAEVSRLARSSGLDVMIWSAGDQRARGFLLGATHGRTTLNGEGLQHEDGHSLLLASTNPACLAYDPAFAYEVATIVREGLRRMYDVGEDVFYYMALYNENYPMPEMPPGAEEGIVKGLYRFREGPNETRRHQAQILGSGPMVVQALKAQELLAAEHDVSATVWSATSYQQLRVDALECERWNRLHPGQPRRDPFVLTTLGANGGPLVAVSDSIKSVPDQIARWIHQPFVSLGTDGWGRSDTREALRRFFEVDSEHIVVATLSALADMGEVKPEAVADAIKRYGIDPDRTSPYFWQA